MNKQYSIDLKWLAEQLDRPGFSQAGLAKALGRDSSAVSRILSGERQIKAVEVPVILSYLKHDEGEPLVAAADLYHMALGEAVSEWSVVEVALDELLKEAVNAPNPTVWRYILVLFQSTRDYTDRLRMLDNVLSIALEEHRNALDTWRALSLKIQRAGERRDQHLNAIAMIAREQPYGGTFGVRIRLPHVGDKAAERISVQRLHEDANHFRTIRNEVISLSHELRNLSPNQ